MGRFNAPEGEYGVLYLGTDAHCAFIETFGQSLQRLVSEEALVQRCLCRIDTMPNRDPFRLVDLTAEGLSRLGADARLTTMTDDLSLPKRWALALHQHPTQPDGILYRVRHDPARTGVALFDRIDDALHADCAENVLARPEVLAAIVAHYGFSLIPADPASR